MEYELKLDDLLKSLTELGIDTDKLTIVEKSPQQNSEENKMKPVKFLSKGKMKSLKSFPLRSM